MASKIGFKNSTSVAEKKITFTVLSQDNIPLFDTSSTPCEYNDLFVIDKR